MEEHATACAEFVAAQEKYRLAEERMEQACRPVLQKLIDADDWKGAYAFVYLMPSSTTKALFADWVGQKWPRPRS